MPIPDPKKYKNRDEYVEACMSAIGDEYDDKDQALAICFDKWKKKEKKSMDTSIERRYTPHDVAEIRIQTKGGKATKLVGYFAKFGKRSGNLGGFVEIIERGFFKDALEGSDIVDLFNHDPNYVLGRESAGTLKVWEDKIGLRYECKIPDTQTIRDLVLSPIERGDIKGNSFGFRVKPNGDDWGEDENGLAIRTLRAGGCAEIIDGSQVTFPAYPDTQVALRSLEEHKESIKPENDSEPAEETLEAEQETSEEETFVAIALARKRYLDLRLRDTEDESDAKSE